MGRVPARPAAVGARYKPGKLDGARRSARRKAVEGARLRLGGHPACALDLEKVEILRCCRREQRAVNRMERKALLRRVRKRFALVRLRELALRVRERVQLRRLLREQHDEGE